MALDAAKNFAKITVSTGYDASATSIVLTAGHGARLPAAPFNIVWWDSTNYPDPSDDPNREIVRCTVISTDTLTVTRAQESTSATTKNTGAAVYKMIAGLTAASYVKLADHGEMTGLADDDHTQYHTDARAVTWFASAVAGKAVVRKLSQTGFNGATKTFTDWLPTAPEIATNDVVLIQTGVGILVRVASGEVNGEFSLSGGTNRTINFGFAPRTGDWVYAIYVQA